VSITRLTFRPPAWATLLLLAACALFASAGFWQLDRKAEKEDLFARFDRGAGVDPLSSLPTDAEAAAARYRPISLRGRYDPERQVLLDNIVREGKTGYLVLTPLRTQNGVVMVNRGWLAADAKRDRLPAVGVADNSREVRGLVDQFPQPGLRLAAESPQPEDPWPRRLLFPKSADIETHLGYAIAGYQVLLDPAAPDGFQREWRPGVSGPNTHLGYAVQWFAFAAAVTVIYVVLNLKKIRTSE